MTRFPAVLTAVLVLAAACASRDDADAGAPRDGAPADDAACPSDVHRALSTWEAAGFSGSIAVTGAGAPECVAAFGIADPASGRANTPDTVFSLGSVSKAVTAAAVYRLVDAGALALDDRAGDLVPGLTGPATDATVEQLLVHTSGLADAHGTDHEPLDRDGAMAAIGSLPTEAPRGSEYRYSNAGYTLLAAIVEEAAGVPYRDALVSGALRLPDGGVAGGFWDGEPAASGPRAIGELEDGSTGERGDFPGPHWAMTGNGDVAMTMPDLAAWTRALFTGRSLSPESTAAIARPMVDHGDGTAETPGWVWLDASVAGTTVLAAAGGGGDVGHDAVVMWVPDGERVIAVASNGPEVTAEDLLHAVGPALIAGEPLPEPEVVDTVDPDDVDGAQGRYELASGGSFEVTARDDRLAVAATGADAVAALFPPPDGTDAAEVRAHEATVLALLAGETAAGVEERAAVADDLGPIEAVEPAGTIVSGGELRTYVTLRTAGGSVLAWYALDDQGGVSAVELAASPPTQTFGATGGGDLRPDDPAGTAADVTLRVDGDRLTLTSAAGSITARAAG